MRCLKPIGIIDKVTKLARQVPCGQCVACRINYALDWAYRCHIESLHYSDDSMCFLTLTYNDQNCVGTLSKRDLQLFFKRLRKHGLKLRYLACGEYGPSTMRPHYHLILFGVGQDSDIWLDKHYSAKLHGYKCFCKYWPFGFAFLGGVTRQSIAYCCKYTLKSIKGKDAKIVYDDRGLVRPFLLTSRRPGIGSDVDRSWLLNNNHKRLSSSYLEEHPDANICLLPRYYLDRLFPAGSEERELLKENWQRSFNCSSSDEYIPVEVIRARNQARELEIESALELRHDRSRV